MARTDYALAVFNDVRFKEAYESTETDDSGSGQFLVGTHCAVVR